MEPRRDNDTEIQPSGGDQMKVGDLVKLLHYGHLGGDDRVGLLIKQLPSPAHWIVLWSDGVRDTVKVSLLEVINESR